MHKIEITLLAASLNTPLLVEPFLLLIWNNDRVWLVETSQMKVKPTVLSYFSSRSKSSYGKFFKILDVNQTWYMYMWWWKSADILHEHNLSTPHCANWRFIDYVIWLIKIYRVYKGYKTIYYKLWEKSGFHLSSSWMIDLGPTHANQVARSSCRISLVLLRERAGAP